MSQHTPGPWRPWEGGPSHMVVGGDETTVACLSLLAADTGDHASTEFANQETRTANARLIAAAPDLLAALTGMLAVSETATIEQERARLVAARSAIARATGGGS